LRVPLVAINNDDAIAVDGKDIDEAAVSIPSGQMSKEPPSVKDTLRLSKNLRSRRRGIAGSDGLM